jgi:mono/diheme cytochrome c family protein
MLAVSRALPSLIIIGALTVGPARGQNLDQDKSGAKLFATNCTDCHRSPRGLAKDRFSWTLSSFLQQHYTASPTSAHALTAYLQSVDTPRAKPQPAARTSQPPGASGTVPPPRPPAPVPAR